MVASFGHEQEANVRALLEFRFSYPGTRMMTRVMVRNQRREVQMRDEVLDGLMAAEKGEDGWEGE
ncbi:hypothetical protein [Microvirga terrestris]|uniref:Uncharacterized protein n=1 Tax=Microvirga terrestris TaxID=2791024 RepID=A0ABS0HXM8_9HYPH|nr:hypothetical protein [Microvirga terrestris]MBF9197915.1 hypothetical protein [Microvirga terrestris]